MHTGNLWITLSLLAPLLPLVLGGMRWTKLSWAQKLLLGWCAAELVFEWAGRWMAAAFETNHPMMHGYVLLETITLLLLFQPAIESWLSKQKLWIVIGLFTGFALVNGLFIQGFDAYASNSRLAESFLLIAMSLTWFFQLFREQAVERPERYFHFWMAVGLLLYFSSNVIVWAYGDLRGNSGEAYFVQVWTIHAISNVVLHLIYTVALWMKPWKSMS